MRYFNPRADIAKTKHRLVHWQQRETAVAVTFRLSDSLPMEILGPIIAERDEFLSRHPQPWDDATEALYHARFMVRIQDCLDKGYGCCALRDLRIARIVCDRLHHFDGERYDLWSYVIMPNHVHVLFGLKGQTSLPATIQSWKGVSSRLIHKSGLSDLNPFWQSDYHDRLIRSAEHLAWARKYIRDNPVVAGLKVGSYVVWEREPCD